MLGTSVVRSMAADAGRKLKVLLSQRLPEASMERFYKTFEGTFYPESEYSSQGLVKAAQEISADALFITLTEKFDKSMIDALPASVKCITTLSVGFDHIDLSAAKERGIVVTNTPDVLTEATAETTVLCLLGAARRAHEALDLIYNRQWTGATPTLLLGSQVHGKTLAIIGMGRIGQRTAEVMSRGFGMKVHYHNRRRLPQEIEDRIGNVVYHKSIDELLPFAEFLTIHCPASPQMVKFLNKNTISKLPDGCIFVNTARGSLVDDEALIDALKSGKIAAAGLDVFDGEPNINEGYLKLPNVFLLPHIGSATVETRNKMSDLCINSILEVFGGKKPHNTVKV